MCAVEHDGTRTAVVRGSVVKTERSDSLRLMTASRVIGDVTNTSLLALSVVYVVCVVGHVARWWSLEATFGSNWAADGFCLSFKDTMAHSHLLCFYTDTLAALCLAWLSRRTVTAGRPELKLVGDNVVGIFFHGLAHAYLWAFRERYSTLAPEEAMLPGALPMEAAIFCVVGFLFWFPFLHYQTPNPLWSSVLQSVLHTYLIGWVCPFILVFTYANTILLFNDGCGRLLCGLEGKRDEFYALAALLYSTPIMVATWAEPLLCDDFLVNWGGHMWFDLSIPTGAAVYYIVASSLPRRDAKHAKSV